MRPKHKKQRFARKSKSLPPNHISRIEETATAPTKGSAASIYGKMNEESVIKFYFIILLERSFLLFVFFAFRRFRQEAFNRIGRDGIHPA